MHSYITHFIVKAIILTKEIPMNAMRTKLFLTCTIVLFNGLYGDAAPQEPVQAQYEVAMPAAEVDQNNNVQNTVMTTFLTMVQNFITIIQNPENAEIISDNVADTMSNLVNAAAEIMQQMPQNATEQQKQEYIATLEEALMAGIRTIITDK